MGKGIGRPKESIDKRLSKITLTLERVKRLYLAGWTDEQVADFLGVTRQAIEKWKKLNKFSLHLKDWKKEADEKVEKSLYKRAIGYEYDEITYEKSKIGGLGIKLSEGEIEDIKHCDTYKTKVITKQVVPDVLAEIFWLKNRQPEKWSDRTNIDLGLKENLIEKLEGISVPELLAKANALIGKPSKT